MPQQSETKMMVELKIRATKYVDTVTKSKNMQKFSVSVEKYATLCTLIKIKS